MNNPIDVTITVHARTPSDTLNIPELTTIPPVQVLCIRISPPANHQLVSEILHRAANSLLLELDQITIS
jgi:hypothetical protein